MLKNALFIASLVIGYILICLGIVTLDSSSAMIEFQSNNPDAMRLIHIACASFLPVIITIGISATFITAKLKKFQFNFSSIKIWQG